jgi:hypothetical protein
MVLVLGTPWVASLGIGCMGYWVLALIKVAMGHSFGSWLLCVAGFWMLGPSWVTTLGCWSFNDPSVGVVNVGVSVFLTQSYFIESQVA